MKTEPREDEQTPLEAVGVPEPAGRVRAEKKPSAWRVLRHRDYSLLFGGQLVSAAGTQMQIVAVSWQVYQLTHSPIALGLIGLLQAIPRLLLSLVGGVFADVFDRRMMLLIIDSTLA
ncbi:MAG: MFS transporter, partial [Ktedonobacterales bacterium]